MMMPTSHTLLVPRGVWEVSIILTWYDDVIQVAKFNTDEHGTSSAFSQPTTPPETIVFIEFSDTCPQYLFTVFSQSNCKFKLLANHNTANINTAAFRACLFLVDFFAVLSHLPFLA